jgi:hypothetical protein
MNRVYLVILVVAAVITLFLVLNAITPVVFKSDNLFKAQIIVSTELENISQTDIEGVKKEALKALKFIPPILGVEYEKAIDVKIVDNGVTCRATGGTVSLLISHVRGNIAPIIHEVTHIITRHQDNRFFTEGVAVYFQERFGKNQAFPNFSESINDLMRRNKDQFIPITRLINDNGIFEQVDTEQRRLAYLTAGSFISFLVEKYGEQKLADLNNSRTLNYKKVYGKGIYHLEAEWKNHVFEELFEVKKNRGEIPRSR